VFGRSEQSRKAGGAVEARPAQPIDGAVTTDKGSRRAIADQCIVLDGQRQRAASAITVRGARYPEQLEATTGR